MALQQITVCQKLHSDELTHTQKQSIHTQTHIHHLLVSSVLSFVLLNTENGLILTNTLLCHEALSSISVLSGFYPLLEMEMFLRFYYKCQKN